MAFKKNSPGCNAASGCGCNPGCVTFLDEDFSGANGSFSDPDWTVVSGTWNRTGGTALTTSGGGIIICSFDNPLGVADAFIEVDYISGGNLGVIIDYIDSSNYKYARIGPDGVLVLVSVVGGVQTQMNRGDFSSSPYGTVRVGIGANASATGTTGLEMEYCFSIGGSAQSLSYRLPATATGLKVGLRSESSGITVGNFAWKSRPCVLFNKTDDMGFNGEEGDPGTGPVLSGTFAGGGANEPKTADALKVTLATYNQEPNGYAQASLDFDYSGGAARSDVRVCVNVADANNYVCAEIGNDDVLRIIEKSGGSDSTLASTSVTNEAGVLTICYSLGKLKATFDPISGSPVSVQTSYATTSSTRTRIGWGTGPDVTLFGGGGGIAYVANAITMKSRYDGTHCDECY